MYAHCFRSGEIEISRKAKIEGAIQIAEAPADVLRRKVSARSRHAYDGKTLLVPGIPEAETDDEAYDAMMRFKAFLAK